MYKRNCFLLASLHAYKEHIPIHSTAVKIHPKLNLWDWAGWRGDIHTTHVNKVPNSTGHFRHHREPKMAPETFPSLCSLTYISCGGISFLHFHITIPVGTQKRITFTNLIIGIVDFYFGRFQRFTCRITSRRET